MENPIMTILTKYCARQGIELRNMEEVAFQVENALDDLIPDIVHQVGELVEEE